MRNILKYIYQFYVPISILSHKNRFANCIFRFDGVNAYCAIEIIN